MKKYDTKIFDELVNKFTRFITVDDNTWQGDAFWNGVFSSAGAFCDTHSTELYGKLLVQNGGSCNGYLSCCNGYVQLTIQFNPYADIVDLYGHPRMRIGVGYCNGRWVTETSREIAAECQKKIDDLHNEEQILRDVYSWKNEFEGINLSEIFTSEDEMIKWLRSDEDRDDVTHDDVYDICRAYWEESPAFLNVELVLDNGNKNRECKNVEAALSVSYNDDFVYNRPSGSTTFYTKTLSFKSADDMVKSSVLDACIEDAFACIDISPLQTEMRKVA